MHQSLDNETSIKYLKIIGSCYATGDFEPLFPYLSTDCVWESQWRMTPETGKDSVMKYFRKKGEILRDSKAFPKWMMVEFIGNGKPVRSNVKVQGEWQQNAHTMLFYPEGELALFMSQDLKDYSNAIILRIKANDEKLITRIDLCMPELFMFKKYENTER